MDGPARGLLSGLGSGIGRVPNRVTLELSGPSLAGLTLAGCSPVFLRLPASLGCRGWTCIRTRFRGYIMGTPGFTLGPLFLCWWDT